MGPVNSLVKFAQGDVSGFESVFGTAKRSVEKMGNFGIKVCTDALKAGPIGVVNIRKFDKDRDITSVATINPNSWMHTNIKDTVPYEDLFDTNGFWSPKASNITTKYYGTSYSDQAYLNFGNVGVKNISLYVIKSTKEDVEMYTNQGDETLEKTSLSIEDYPGLNWNTKLADTFVSVYVFENDFENPTNDYAKYFVYEDNEYLLPLENINKLANDKYSGFIGKYVGTVVPGVVSENGEEISIERVMFNNYMTTGIICDIDQDKLESALNPEKPVIDLEGITAVPNITGILTTSTLQFEGMMSYHDDGMTVDTNLYYWDATNKKVTRDNFAPADISKPEIFTQYLIEKDDSKSTANQFYMPSQQGLRVGDYLLAEDGGLTTVENIENIGSFSERKMKDLVYDYVKLVKVGDIYYYITNDTWVKSENMNGKTLDPLAAPEDLIKWYEIDIDFTTTGSTLPGQTTITFVDALAHGNVIYAVGNDTIVNYLVTYDTLLGTKTTRVFGGKLINTIEKGKGDEIFMVASPYIHVKKDSEDWRTVNCLKNYYDDSDHSRGYEDCDLIKWIPATNGSTAAYLMFPTRYYKDPLYLNYCYCVFDQPLTSINDNNTKVYKIYIPTDKTNMADYMPGNSGFFISIGYTDTNVYAITPTDAAYLKLSSLNPIDSNSNKFIDDGSGSDLIFKYVTDFFGGTFDFAPSLSPSHVKTISMKKGIVIYTTEKKIDSSNNKDLYYFIDDTTAYSNIEPVYDGVATTTQVGSTFSLSSNETVLSTTLTSFLSGISVIEETGGTKYLLINVSEDTSLIPEKSNILRKLELYESQPQAIDYRSDTIPTDQFLTLQEWYSLAYDMCRYTTTAEYKKVKTLASNETPYTDADGKQSHLIIRYHPFVNDPDILLNSFLLKSYKPSKDQFLNGTKERQSEILSVPVNVKSGLLKGLKDTKGLRYLVDTFKSYLETSYKWEFGTLAELLHENNRYVTCIINEPFVTDMLKSTNPLYKQTPEDKIISWEYLPDGGNKQYTTTLVDKFTEGAGWCFFFGPADIIGDIPKPLSGLISNLFVTKQFQFDIVANSTGYLDGVTTLEENFSDTDRKYLEKFRYNPIIDFGGITIFGNLSGQKTISKQQQIHNVELLCYIKDSLYNMAKADVFKKGTYDEYLRTQIEVQNFMDALVLQGAINPNPVVQCDLSNNTTEVSNYKIKLVRVEYTPYNCIEKVVFDINIF
jgi:hypothetical protein